MPTLGVGEMAIEGREVGLLEELGQLDLVHVRLDNPLLVWRGLPMTQSDGVDTYPESQRVKFDPFSIVNRYADVQSVATNGEGPYIDGTHVGSVDDFRLLAYARQDGHADTAAAANFFTRGLRVGYPTLRVYGSVRDRSDNVEQRTNTHQDVALDPRVYLVPVEVWVMRSTNHPSKYQRRQRQAVFWDQQQETDVVNTLEPLPAGRVKVAHTLAHTPEGATIDTWLDPVKYPGLPVYFGGGNIITPDAALASCGVQFRMVQYREIDVPGRVAFPLRQGGGEPQDDAHYQKEVQADSPCRERSGIISAHPDHQPNRLVVVFTEREGFPDATSVNGGEASRYYAAGQLICTSLVGTDARGPLVAHEIGHAAGLSDCEKGEDCVLMSGGGGRLPASPLECGTIRRWGYQRAAGENWNLAGVLLEPPPPSPEEWKWPE